MDAVFEALIGVAPELGIGGVLLAFSVFRERVLAGDREFFRTERTAMVAERDTEKASLRKELTEVREENEKLEARLDTERDRRRAAEDGAPRHRLEEGS